MSAATREIESLGHAVWMPLTLLINFSLFQYLLTIYFRRRWELRVILLLMCAFIGFVTLIPFAHTNERLVSGLNEISETSCTLTFLIQIVILGRDVLQNARIRSLHYLTFIAELFCLFGLFVVIQNLVEINMQRLDPSPLDGIMEDGGLAFVFIVRFFFLMMIIGLRSVLTTKRLEIFAYSFLSLMNTSGSLPNTTRGWRGKMLRPCGFASR